MFTVKQVSGTGDALWPDIRHVWGAANNTSEIIDTVICQFDAGGELRFDSGPGKSIVYVMNESGATVARYDLGGRLLGDPRVSAQAADLEKLAA